MSSPQTTDSLLAFPAHEDDNAQDPYPPYLPLTISRSHSFSATKPNRRGSSGLPLKPFNSNSAVHSSSKPKHRRFVGAGKENLGPKLSDVGSLDSRAETASSFIAHGYDVVSVIDNCQGQLETFISESDSGLDSIQSTIDCSYRIEDGSITYKSGVSTSPFTEKIERKQKGGYLFNSIESRLLKFGVDCVPNVTDFQNDCGNDSENDSEEFEPGSPLDALLNLCSEVDEQYSNSNPADFPPPLQYDTSGDDPICCPLCGVDITALRDEERQVHTNHCLDKPEAPDLVFADDKTRLQCPGQVIDGSPVQLPQPATDVSKWLHGLGLARYGEVFAREEIDWDTLQWLTEEDLFNIGVTSLGPRKKIIHALSELRRKDTKVIEIQTDASKVVVDESGRLAANKLITDYFPGSVACRKKGNTASKGCQEVHKKHSDADSNGAGTKNRFTSRKLREIPLWCCILGTPFRVDAFKYLRRDCAHWFLSHFHIDHYQGLTRSFCHGKIYCSLITARLVNLKIGISWDKLHVLPLNQKFNIDGVDVTCFDANHCPGSIIMLFEPPNGKAVLHTGDFRFNEEMAKISILQTCPIHTLILDTTYCDPQYDFPKQEAVIQFVLEAIQAEAFNPRTLFLIGSYTIGKERLFLEVARVLRKKVYVTAAKLRLLECLGIPKEDMLWFTSNEQESQIHVVPMWTLASFKRLKHISNQYMARGRFSLVVALSPTGWTFGKGKKKSPGRRWQQGTIIRYEVPYSEHCSFTELKEFVKFISPVDIIPSVNNNGPESTSTMLSLLN